MAVNSSTQTVTFTVSGNAFLNTVGACQARNSALCSLVANNSNVTNVAITKVPGDAYI